MIICCSSTHTHTFIPPYSRTSLLLLLCPLVAIQLVFGGTEPSSSYKWCLSLVCFSIIALISFDNSNIMTCWIIVLISVWSFFAYAKTVDDYDVISPLSPILLFRITTTPRNLNITILKCVFSHFFTSVFFAIYRYTFFLF